MTVISKTKADEHQDQGFFEEWTTHVDGYTVNVTDIRQGHDLAPMLRGLPDDKCQCPHWGYLLSGRITVRYADRVEVIEPGDAFYMAPGHAPAAEDGTSLIQFSPQDKLAETVTAIQRNMAAAG